MPAEPAADPVGTVDFHFDVMCPWAYQASLWIRDVRERLGLEVLDRWYLAAAVRLWRLMTGWLEFPQLYEVQRPKSQQGLRAIAETFRPYLEARDWISIQEEAP